MTTTIPVLQQFLPNKQICKNPGSYETLHKDSYQTTVHLIVNLDVQPNLTKSALLPIFG